MQECHGYAFVVTGSSVAGMSSQLVCPTCHHCKEVATASEGLEVNGLQKMEDVRASVEN